MMLPEGCHEVRGSVDSPFKTIMECWCECTYGYFEPDEVRASKETADSILQPNLVSFREGKVIIDNTLAVGIVELYNSQKQENPLFHGRVIFDDFRERT